MLNVNIENGHFLIKNLVMTEHEKWLYLPLEELLNKKGVFDKRIVHNHTKGIDLLREKNTDMDITTIPSENAEWIYSESVESIMIIAMDLQYKNCALLRCRETVTNAQRNRIEKQILALIRNKENISYFEILSLQEEDGWNLVLESMIQKRVIAAIFSDDGEGFIRWRTMNLYK